jgi:hypothetical protein
MLRHELETSRQRRRTQRDISETLSRLGRLANKADLSTLVRIRLSVKSLYESESGHAATLRGTQRRLSVMSNRGSKGGEFLNAVKWALERLDLRFTVAQIHEVLLKEDYVFQARRQRLAIADALRALKKSGYVIEYEPGKGRRATIYQRVTDSMRH